MRLLFLLLSAGLFLLPAERVSPLSLQNEPSPSGQSFENGIRLLGEKKFAEAEAEFGEALRKGEDSALVARPLAETFRYLGNTDGALNLYYFLLKRDSTDTDSRFWLATLLRWTGKFDLSIPEYEALIRAVPGHGDALFGLAIALDATGKTEDAIQRLEELKKAVPQHIDARIALARFYRKENRDDDAMREYMEILKVSPGSRAAKEELDRLRRDRSPTFQETYLFSDYRAIEGRQDPRSYEIRYFFSETKAGGKIPISQLMNLRGETKRGVLSQENRTFGFTYYDLASLENSLALEMRLGNLGTGEISASVAEFRNRGSASSLSGKKSFGTFNLNFRSKNNGFSFQGEGKPVLVRGAREDAYFGIYQVRTLRASGTLPEAKRRLDLLGFLSAYSGGIRAGSVSLSGEFWNAGSWIRGSLSRWPLELRGLTSSKKLRFGYVTTGNIRARKGISKTGNLWVTLWTNSYYDANSEAGAFLELTQGIPWKNLILKGKAKKSSYRKIASDYMAIGETTGFLALELRGKVGTILHYYFETEEFLRKDVITSSFRGENIYFELKVVGSSRLDLTFGGTLSSNTLGEKGGKAQGVLGFVF